jgi:hypothetical protein
MDEGSASALPDSLLLHETSTPEDEAPDRHDPTLAVGPQAKTRYQFPDRT